MWNRNTNRDTHRFILILLEGSIRSMIVNLESAFFIRTWNYDLLSNKHSINLRDSSRIIRLHIDFEKFIARSPKAR